MGAGVLAAGVVLAAAALACAGASPEPATDAAAGSADPADAPVPGAHEDGDGLRVDLVFGAEADLDLYVTDPLQETVYFANTPTAAGGRLTRDRRCTARAPRTETVRFDDPPPGRYRVGVDFAAACERGVDTAPFVVRVALPGGETHTAEGRIAPLQFLPIVLEFDVSADAP